MIYCAGEELQAACYGTTQWRHYFFIFLMFCFICSHYQNWSCKFSTPAVSCWENLLPL